MKISRRAALKYTAALGGAGLSAFNITSAFGQSIPKSFNYVKTIFGGTGPGGIKTGTTYMLPSSPGPFAVQKSAIALHYAWGPIADALLPNIIPPSLQDYVTDGGKLVGSYAPGSAEYGALTTNIVNVVTSRLVTGAIPATNVVGSQTKMASLFKPTGTLHISVINWSKMIYFGCAFKLDPPAVGHFAIHSAATISRAKVVPDSAKIWDVGRGYTDNSGGVSRIVLSEVHESVKGLYFTGDSFSNWGGWVEGALQSSAKTVAHMLIDMQNRGITLSELSAYTNELSMPMTARDYCWSPIVGFASNEVASAEMHFKPGTSILRFRAGNIIDNLEGLIGGSGGSWRTLNLKNLWGIQLQWGVFEGNNVIGWVRMVYRDGSIQEAGKYNAVSQSRFTEILADAWGLDSFLGLRAWATPNGRYIAALQFKFNNDGFNSPR